MNSSLHATRRSEFWAGSRATIPLMIGALPFGLIFGAVAAAGNVPPAATMAMSLFIFAGSAQFIGVKLLAAGASVPVIVLTIAVVNLRHSLYGMTLGPKLKHLPQRWLALLGFLMTDEAFVVTAQRLERDDDSPYKHWYFFGSAISLFVVWNLMTVVGIIAGERIPDPSRWGLDFALDVTFIGMVIPMIRRRPALVAAVVAGGAALAAHGLPNQLGLMVAALAGVAAGVIAEMLLGEAAGEPAAAEASTP